MKKAAKFLFSVITLWCVLNPISSFSQEENKIVFSATIPVFFNHAEVTNLIGPQRQISGKGYSYGLNLGIQYPTLGNLFLAGEIGYNNLRLGIHRPFDYPSITQPLYTTKSYSYETFMLSIGFGYNKVLRSNWSLKFLMTYHLGFTFKQNYYTETNDPTLQVKKSKLFSQSIQISPGLYKRVSNKTSIGINLPVPFIVRWKKDTLFRENEGEYYHPKFIWGISLSTIVNL